MSRDAMHSTKSGATLVLLTALTVMLGGCASSLNGVGGTERFACQAPVGAQCTSISGVYANGHRTKHLLPPIDVRAVPSLLHDFTGSAPQALATSPTDAPPSSSSATRSPTSAGAASVPTTLRASPRVVRLWIAPWEDADGDLHEASFVHVVIDTGRWLIERVRPAPRSRLDIALPPMRPTPMSAPSSGAPSPTDPAPVEP